MRSNKNQVIQIIDIIEMKTATIHHFRVILYMLIMASSAVAQVPARLSYQAVIRDGADKVIANAPIAIRLSILQGSPEGLAVYVETHNTQTNANGLISIQLGGGTSQTGAIETIDWSQGPYFVKSETDPNGGTNFSITGTSELMSVPYALFAGNSNVPGPQGAQGPSGPAGPMGPEGPPGEQGNGITQVIDNGTGRLTFHFDDGTTYTTPDLTGPPGPAGDQDLSVYVKTADLETEVPKNETDPVYSASPASGVTVTNVNTWNASYAWGDHSIAGYLKTESQGLGAVLERNTNGENNPIQNVSKLSVGGEGAEASAIVELSSTDKGFLPPRMGDVFRDAIPSPTEGLIIYNTNAKRPQYFDGQAWHNLDGTANAPQGNAYYVSADSPNAADQAGAGTKTTPFRTITYAIQQAGVNGFENVIIAKGTYNETIMLAQGVNLLGGFDDATWVRFAGDNAETIIRGTSGPLSHAATIMGQSISQPTVINGLTIVGQNAQSPSGNSYAIYLNNSPGVIMSDNFIIAGNGANGNTGSGGTNGVNGVAGANGAAAIEAVGTGECNVSNNRTGASGGLLSVGGVNISGGRGGGNQCPPIAGVQSSSLAGQNGLASFQAGAGGQGGARAYDGGFSSGVCQLPGGSMLGADGTAGGDGVFGASGVGATTNAGTIIGGGHWFQSTGSSGAPGKPGGGGGGGSSGGGSECLSGCTHAWLGGTGGGGGSGGGGGGAGHGGGGGGGSFGIFIVNGASPVIFDNYILLGSGGNGGYGGYGATGGAGAAGGLGGASSVLCAGPGGDGGNGGDGGHGGGGGGGAGGNAYGIFTYNVTGSADYLSSENNNTFSGGQAGKGGIGGRSLGREGSDGVDGMVGLVGGF